MSQSKTASGIEAVTNQIVGYIMSIVVGIQLYKFLDVEISLTNNFAVTTVFILMALFRSYFMRRLFNWWDLSGRAYFKAELRKAQGQ